MHNKHRQLAFHGTEEDFLALFAGTTHEVTVHHLPDMTRFRVNGINVDWWPDSRKKTIHVNGGPPYLVENIQEVVEELLKEKNGNPSW